MKSLCPTTKIDVGASYAWNVGNGSLTTRLDIFDVLDFDGVTEIGIADEESGTQSQTFGLPFYFQQLRSVRLGLQYDIGG